MFKKNKIPQRKEFNFSSDQVMEDVNNIAQDEEQREKLFLCIDEKIPQKDARFSQLNEFLESHNNLEEVSTSLKDLCDNLRCVSAELLKEGASITRVAKEALESLNS